MDAAAVARWPGGRRMAECHYIIIFAKYNNTMLFC